MTDAIKVVPANEVSCADLAAVFGTRGEAALCQRFKTQARAWDAEPVSTEMMRIDFEAKP
jgi:hypothetical protein